MVLKNTAVHDHFETRRAGRGGGFFVNHTELHPDDAGVASDGRFDNVGNVFGAAEDVDDFESLRNVIKGGVGPLAENLGFAWIDRNDSIPGALHVPRHREAWAPRMGGKTDDGNGAIRFQDFFDAHETLSSDSRNFSFCSRVPTDTRIAGGTPQAGRTITPCFNSARHTSRAGFPRSKRRKLAKDGTYLTPRLDSSRYKNSSPSRFIFTLFSTCSRSPHAASAATCATLLVLKAMRTLYNV